MNRDTQDDDGAFTSLKQGTTRSDEVEAYYDDWAGTYDDTLDAWNYRAPGDAADLLVPHLRDGARVLDVGCGTGLLAAALLKRGRYALDGVDISQGSLELAGARGVYARLMHHDLQRIPLPVEDDGYDAAASVGVLTYIESAEALLRDLCRCVRAGGVIAFTQRSDLWEARDFPAIIARLQAAGLWHQLQVSEPKPYLPGNEDFADEIRVIHTLCRVAA